jgi:epidermal growth factor receptor substrate 15
MHADQKKTGFLGKPEFFNALRLVTVAQSGRHLTPDIVQSALYGPAAARIPAPKIATGPAPPQMGAAGAPRPQGSAAMAPAPGQVGAGQMNQAATPRPQGSGMMPTSNQVSSPQVNHGAAQRPQGINSMTPAASQGAAMQATQFAGPRAMQPQPPSTGFNQQQPPSSTGFMRPPQMGASATSLQAQIPGSNQSPLGGGSMGGSVGWQGRNFGSVGGAPQATTGGGAAPSQTARSGFDLGLPSTMGMAPGQQAQGMPTSPLPPQSNSVVPPQDAKALVLSGNGPDGSSGSSTDIFSALTQPKPSASVPPTLPSSSMPSSSSFMPTPTGSQNMTNLTQIGHLQSSSQPQQTQSVTKPSIPAQTAPGSSPRVTNSASQWPKVAQSDIQKYMKVFADVDKDRDGKITGVEARTLFLSWRLPRGRIPQPPSNCPCRIFMCIIRVLTHICCLNYLFYSDFLSTYFCYLVKKNIFVLCFNLFLFLWLFPCGLLNISLMTEYRCQWLMQVLFF